MKTQNFKFDQRKNPRIINKKIDQAIELRKEIDGNRLGNQIVGKIVDYSLGGWGLILITKFPPKVKDVYQVNPRQLNSHLKSIRVQVKWCKPLNHETFRIGVQSVNMAFKTKLNLGGIEGASKL